MRSYRNPFLARTSEQVTQQGLQRFLRAYGADVLDLLPDELWDRPLIIRSAPGGGKTSLLRAFTVDALGMILARPDDYQDLLEHMREIGAIVEGEPAVLGVRISLAQKYRDLVDLGGTPETSRKLFFRLLDAQIIRSVLDAALTSTGRSFPEDLDALEAVPTVGGLDVLERLGGTGGIGLWEEAREAERAMHDLLDSVLPIDGSSVKGHGIPYSFAALSNCQLHVAGEPVGPKPLLMFDDGQELADSQRKALFDALTNRDLTIHRWYTERFTALEPDEVIGDGEPGRGFVVLPLEQATRELPGRLRRGRKIRSQESMLLDVADRRARVPLLNYGDESENSFRDFLQVDDARDLDEASEAVIPVIQQRVIALAAGRDRYQQWLDDAYLLHGHLAAVRWRELEIVITRDRDRTQLQLLDEVLTSEDLKAQSASSIRESASLFLNQEFRLPYYYGPARLAKLGSQNVEQFLALSANLFEEMLALITLKRRPWLPPRDQDRVVRATSESFWRTIPQRRSYGRDIQHLLMRIAAMAARDTYRPKAPYAPGVSGTALSMRDRDRLLDEDFRKNTPGAETLFRALAGAIGHNLLSAELDRSVKGNRWMVLYLNRMICARFRLPLGYGGFREKSLEDMCRWMAEPPSGDLGGIDVPTLFEA